MYITKIKNPAHTGNNQNHESQICHDLDHTDKHCCFELAMSIHAPQSIPLDYSESEHTEQSSPFAQLITSSLQSPNNYFVESAILHTNPQVLHPLCTFINTNIVFHLNCNPSFKQMSIDNAAEKFGLPDLFPALVDFMHHYRPKDSAMYSIGGWQSMVPCINFHIPKIQIWLGVHMACAPHLLW